MQEEIDEQDDKNKGETKSKSHLLDSGFDIDRGVIRNIDSNVRRQCGFYLFQFAADGSSHIDCVCIGLFDNAETDSGLTAETGDCFFHLGTDFDGGDVPQVDGGALVFAND